MFVRASERERHEVGPIQRGVRVAHDSRERVTAETSAFVMTFEFQNMYLSEQRMSLRQCQGRVMFVRDSEFIACIDLRLEK
jgi:hypothetical protein